MFLQKKLLKLLYNCQHHKSTGNTTLEPGDDHCIESWSAAIEQEPTSEIQKKQAIILVWSSSISDWLLCTYNYLYI